MTKKPGLETGRAFWSLAFFRSMVQLTAVVIAGLEIEIRIADVDEGEAPLVLIAPVMLHLRVADSACAVVISFSHRSDQPS